MKWKSERKIKRDTLYVLSPHALRVRPSASRFTLHVSRVRPSASRFTRYASRSSSSGFTLLAMVGILAVMTILAAVFAPSLVAVKDRQVTDDELRNLRGIADGTELYLRRNRAWAPNLPVHSPDYVPLDSAQLAQNPRGYPRYYAAHPITANFTNSAGIAEADLTALRFLLVSDLSQDAAPTITNAGEFETWWATDETATPDLKIYRGNLATQFHKVDLTFLDTGGSYQIDGTTTDSFGALLTNYSRYHVTGTVVALDEDTPYGTPEIQFALTTDVAYQFDPCRPAGSKWVVAPTPASPCTFLWLTTLGVANGIPSIGTWQPAELMAFEDPNLSYETSDPLGTTSGNYASAFNLENFTASSPSVDAIHHVTRNLTVGTTTTMDVVAGDLLLSVDIDSVTLVSTNTLTVNEEDLFIFRPDQPNDYSSGTFLMLIGGTSNKFTAVTLVEEDTVVGGGTLSAGLFLMSDDEGKDLSIYNLLKAGDGATGFTTTFLKGKEVKIDKGISGVDLVETATDIGDDFTLQAGQLLLTVNADETVGLNLLSVQEEDIFIFDVTNSGLESGKDAATATLLFEGSDVALDTAEEDLNGLTIFYGGL